VMRLVVLMNFCFLEVVDFCLELAKRFRLESVVCWSSPF
jgi:hypothetical protein